MQWKVLKQVWKQRKKKNERKDNKNKEKLKAQMKGKKKWIRVEDSTFMCVCSLWHLFFCMLKILVDHFFIVDILSPQILY
jgi:hypothetical protein